MNFFLIIPFLLQTALWPFMWVMLWVFGKITILGKENIRGHECGAIFAVNHSSQFDPILIPATLNPFSSLMPMFYLARERAFYEKIGPSKYIYGGLLFKIWGAYPVAVGVHNYEYALRYHIEILERGQSICIFPEGGRNLSGGVGEGKPGVAYLLLRTGRPVIPVAIHGHHQMGPREFFSRKHTIVVSYGKPITKEELFGKKIENILPSREELKSATQTIMSHIREMYERI
ncbi:MAG: 1-acyl-sn-glycerol-3-phosphate acyltransferase [Candidatus Yonathbacteria bacterium]|nr:1-acyl-sn-glycerol-3-phosphate acyltransferase [Candidatus Yonathbacteria bacterium]